MRLLFVDSKGETREIAQGDDIGVLIDAMMRHKETRHIYSSGKIVFPGPMDKTSQYVLNQESDKIRYEVVSD